MGEQRRVRFDANASFANGGGPVGIDSITIDGMSTVTSRSGVGGSDAR